MAKYNALDLAKKIVNIAGDMGFSITSLQLQKVMTEYHAFKREKVLELDNNESLLAANAGVLCGQLLQMTSGEIYKRDQLGNKLEEVATLHAAKLEAQ